MTTTNEHGCHFSAENKNRGGKKKKFVRHFDKKARSRCNRFWLDLHRVRSVPRILYDMSCAYHKTLVFALFCRAMGH